MSLFVELKRRNVFKVGIAYLVVAWLVLQFSDVVLNNINAPDWVFGVIMLVLGIAFPVVLIFAWAFEMTPEGLKREHEVDRSQSITHHTGKKLNNTILVLMALAIAYLLYDKFSGGLPDSASTPAVEMADAVSAQEAEPAPDLTAKPQKQSVAVLPFDNRSRLEEDEFFVEGVHDDLLTNLARIGSLKVISRTSVMQYKNTAKTIPVIASELGVATVMEGAVQRSGDTVRINVQLIDAQTDEHLWAEIFDRQLTANNLFEIQSEISQAIANALEATLSPEEQQRIRTMPTENLAAYDAYLRGRQLIATRNVANLERAIETFQEAVDLDPEFALAWVGVAESHMLLWNYGDLDGPTAFGVVEEAAQRALEIDPDLGEAYASLGQVHEYHRRYEDMEAAYRRAVELSPNYATAWHWFSLGVNVNSLRAQDSVDFARRAHELDPRASIIGVNLASAYRLQGLYSLAERQYRSVIELDPGFAGGYSGLADLFLFDLGRFDLALESALVARQVDPVNALARNWHFLALRELGDLAGAEAILQEAEDLNPEHWRLGFFSMQLNHARGNAEGMREASRWMLPRVSGYPIIVNLAAEMELESGNAARARELFLAENPGWTDTGQWSWLIPANPDFSCQVAWVLRETGDPALGEALLRASIDFFETDLPAAIEHPDIHKPDICYAMAGNTDKALASLETQLEHNHLFGWQNYDRLPMFDALRHEPRYQAAFAERERRIAEQRERIAQMNLETGP